MVWTLTPVEVASAIHRRLRGGSPDDAGASLARTPAGASFEHCSLVRDVEAVKDRGMRALAEHPIRSLDALQLAAALQWAEGRPAQRVVHAFDRRRAAAARREGFVVPE